MSGIQILDAPQYDGDLGRGIRIEPTRRYVEIGLTWDGSERWIVRVDAEALKEIAEEAIDWEPEARLVRSDGRPCKKCGHLGP